MFLTTNVGGGGGGGLGGFQNITVTTTIIWPSLLLYHDRERSKQMRTHWVDYDGWGFSVRTFRWKKTRVFTLEYDIHVSDV